MEESFKVVLLGDSSVGKTAIIKRYTQDEFDEYTVPSFAAQYTSKNVTTQAADGTPKSLRLNIYDTAGQERYRAMTPIYYRDATAVLLVYDVTSEHSFANLDRWMGDLRQHAPPNILISLCGNKSDLYEDVAITLEQ